MQSIPREPLLHFAAAALLVFVYFHFTEGPGSDDEVLISKAQLAAKWQQAWRRPPTEEEMEGLV